MTGAGLRIEAHPAGWAVRGWPWAHPIGEGHRRRAGPPVVLVYRRREWAEYAATLDLAHARTLAAAERRLVALDPFAPVEQTVRAKLIAGWPLTRREASLLDDDPELQAFAARGRLVPLPERPI